MKYKIGRRSKYCFVTFTLAMLICLVFVPSVMAYYTSSDVVNFEQGWVQLPYGNGIDDDHDGVIDENDGSEPDVYYGTENYTVGNNTVLDTWKNDYQKDGVIVGGTYEEIWRVLSSDNVSIPANQVCHRISQANGIWEFPTGVINVVTFYVEIPPSKLMNGASEFWYRSPLKYNAAYDYHYLNIFDDHDNIVWSNTANWGTDRDIPYPSHTSDGSLGGTDRYYYKINMNFRTNVVYRFEEYVDTGGAPINSVDLYMARNQDIAGDAQTDTYVFYGSDHPRKIGAECSWSCIFTLGKGLQGGEKIIFGDPDNHGNVSIVSQIIQGAPNVNNTASIRIVFPLRTSRPLNMTVEYKVYSGASVTGWQHDADSYIVTDATGTLIFDCNITTDPNHAAPNQYQFRLNITNLDEDYGGSSANAHAMTFYLYPENESVNNTSFIMITNASGVVEDNVFACHLELAQETAAAAGGGSKGPNLATMLIGIAILIIGIILVVSVIGCIIGIPILFSGLTIATGTAVAALGIGATALGAAMTWSGLSGHTLNQFFEGIRDGAVRIYNQVVSGVMLLAGAIASGVLWMVNAVIDAGLTALRWAAMALEIVWNVLWFVAFIIVLYLWNWFLVLMKYIGKGDIEGAFAHIKKPAKRVTKRVVRYVKATHPLKGKKMSAGQALLRTQFES